MIMPILKNQKGIALISVYMASMLISTISAATFAKSFFEKKQIDREIARMKSFAAAEAGVQNAMAQIGVQAYTGFINTSAINVSNFQQVDGVTVGSYDVILNYPNQADWVIVQATATVDSETRTLEGRVFLESNFSKYLVYANVAAFNSGTDATYGNPDDTDANGDGIVDYPEQVPADSNERAALYFTGSWATVGSNVQLYGDAHAQNQINGNASSEVHGDTYASAFTLSGSGSVTNSGVTGGLIVGDGFSDDLDRNSDATINVADYPDYHDLTSTGGGDSHATETLIPINNSFYSSHNNTPSFNGGSAVTRYLKLVAVNGGTQTQVIQYTNASFTTVTGTTTLPTSAIMYVNGNVYVKGEIGGRVSVVSTKSIYFDGDVKYASAQNYADSGHSTAFMAKNQLYFRPNSISVSGILYSENSGSASAAFDGSQTLSGGSTSSKPYLRLYGNRVMNGSTNMSIYSDRIYAYDINLRYFRPPGLPVLPSLRTVREA